MAFPCSVTNFPCRYLRIPLSLKRLSRADELPLIDVVAARILTWKDGLLTNARRVTLTKATLSAIPIHLSIACCLSSWVISQIDKRRRAFIWTALTLATVENVVSRGLWSTGRRSLGALDYWTCGFSGMHSGCDGSGCRVRTLALLGVAAIAY